MNPLEEPHYVLTGENEKKNLKKVKEKRPQRTKSPSITHANFAVCIP